MSGQGLTIAQFAWMVRISTTHTQSGQSNVDNLPKQSPRYYLDVLTSLGRARDSLLAISSFHSGCALVYVV